MARFKEAQKDEQKDSAFKIETSTVDADIDAPKPVTQEVKQSPV
jgi:hypothetical protein